MTPFHSLPSLLLAAVMPQAPTAPDGEAKPIALPAEVVAHARAFPESTLACLSLAASTAQMDALAETPLVTALVAELGERGVTAASLDRVLTDTTGVALAQWLTLPHNGLTVGLTGLDGDGTPHWLVVADAQDHATVFAQLLDRLRQAPNVSAMAAEDGNARTWTLTTSTGRAAVTIADNKILAGDSSATIGEALARLRAAEEPRSLATTPGFANFELVASSQSDRLLTLWLRPSLIAEVVVDSMKDDAAGADKLQGILRALDLTRITGVGFSLAREDSQFVEDVHIAWPGPRNGPFAELLAPKATLRSEVAALMPADVDSFSASAVDLQRLFHTSMRLLSEVAPGVGRMLEARLAAAGDAVGVNLQDELLGKVGNQVVSLQWTSQDSPGTALIVQLADAPMFERSLRRVTSGMRDLHEQSVNGYRTLVLPVAGAEYALAVTEDSLVLASSTACMQRTLDQMSAPPGTEPRIKVDSGLSAFATTKVRSLLAQIESALGRAEGMALDLPTDAMFAAGLAALRQAVSDDTAMTSSAARDEHDVSMHVESPIGGFVTMAMVIGAGIACPTLVALGADTVAKARPEITMPALLGRLVAAERDYRSSHEGKGSVSLGALIEDGRLPASDLGQPVDAHTYERDGYRLTILHGDAAHAADFVAVAWPASQRTGPVFAATSEHPNLVNDVMARVAGLAAVDVADVYTNGFGSSMCSGWRVADAAPAESMTAKAATTSAAAAGALAGAVATLTAGEGDVQAARAELHAALSGTDPTALAYAAHAAGRLKLADEVPSLVTLVAKNPDLTVRTHAMWALLQINDPRSTQTTIEALTSEAPELRALAAANLGKLRAAEAGAALLGILPKDAGAERDQRDRALALLALADIGDPSPILQAAAAVQDGDARTVQALTYAFQVLSPKLPAKEEATTLVAVLDHPQPMLRRYAIQRLGELRDPVTVRALEGRLAQESRELLPLVEVSLQAVRRQGTGDDSTSRSFSATVQRLVTRAQQTWSELNPNHRLAVLGVAIALVCALLLAGLLRRRARVRAQGQAWAAMAASSQSGQFRPQDEVDLTVGESGVYSADDEEADSALEPTSEDFVAPHR
ncbi:MAG: HEAT repeat domain-containing protein [Planctomycetota bacterium]